MSDFLQQQHVGKKERRKKLFRSFLLKTHRISHVFMVWFMLIGAIYGIYYLVFGYDLFRVKNIEVEGILEHTAVNDIKQAAGVSFGMNLFAISTDEVQKRISADPWVREVAVARKLPDTLWIYINEYSPFAVLSSDKLYLVDDEGVVFKEVGANDDKNLPVLTGLEKDSYMGASIALLKLYFESPLADYFVPAEVHVSASTGYSIILQNDGAVIKLGFDQMSQKLERLYSMLGAIEKGGNKIRYVDLNMPGKVVVKYEG